MNKKELEKHHEHHAINGDVAKLIVEIEILGQQPLTIELSEPSVEKLVQAVHHHAGTEEIFIFEKDKDDELSNIDGRSAISLVAHRCKHVEVHINFEHMTKTKSFSPSATVFRVLSWAVGKHGFSLDDTARAKANLILPGKESPLPRDEVISKNLTDHNCSITLELTLRDFTNGRS